jgi:hypothetical protein
MNRRIPLPKAVAQIYRAVAELESQYEGRKLTPDGHLVGSIGEVIAREAFGFTLHPASYPKHDAYDVNGQIQIKMTAGDRVSMYGECDRLTVFRVISPEEAEIIYDGVGKPVWALAGKKQKNGQRTISVAKLRKLTSDCL